MEINKFDQVKVISASYVGKVIVMSVYPLSETIIGRNFQKKDMTFGFREIKENFGQTWRTKK